MGTHGRRSGGAGEESRSGLTWARRISRKALWAAEAVFLLSYGWRRLDEPDLWWPPNGYPKMYAHRHGHAVNSQKFWGRPL